MRKSVSMIVAVLSLLVPLGFVRSSPAEKGLTGKWVTDTVVSAAQRKKAKEAERIQNEPVVDPFGVTGGLRGPRGGLRGAGPRARGNNFLQSAAQVSQRQASRAEAEPSEDEEKPEAPAITMDLKVDKAKL